MCYTDGNGVPQDFGEAAQWFRLGADQGDARAQYNRAACCQNGDGIPQDSAEAARWFRLAADQGHAAALAAIAHLGL
jgi:TPR repeat protein